MTEFQKLCELKVRDLLSKTPGIPAIDFQEDHVTAESTSSALARLVNQILGKDVPPAREKSLPEKYRVLKLQFRGHAVEIYVYENAAEVSRDGTAYICERPDYRSEEELFEDFTRQISAALLETSFRGNRKGASKIQLIGLGLAVIVGAGGVLWLIANSMVGH